jgi:hypothetical protein
LELLLGGMPQKVRLVASPRGPLERLKCKLHADNLTFDPEIVYIESESMYSDYFNVTFISSLFYLKYICS